MAKSLVNRVEQYLTLREKPQRNAVGMFIIANKQELQTAIQNGYSVKAIWETLAGEGRLKCTYQAFQQRIKQEFHSNTPIPKSDSAILAAKTQPMNQVGEAGFIFNPHADEKELY